MADNTLIEWARHPVTGKGATWNPITGCTLESEGCRNCYAARLAATRLKHTPSRQGLARLNAQGAAKFTGEVRFNEEWLDQPLRWTAPRGIFVCAHGDLFAPGGEVERTLGFPSINWVICGGESGKDARPMHPDWARSLRDQCAAAGVPFLFKQWGEWLPDRMMENFTRGCLMRADGTRATVDADFDAIIRGDFNFAGWQHFAAIGKKAAGRLLDGVTHDAMPGVA